jgi:hypothetical protein
MNAVFSMILNLMKNCDFITADIQNRYLLFLIFDL